MKSSHPTCTHCGHEFDDEEMWYGNQSRIIDIEDGGDSKLKCLSDDCGKTFFVRCERPIRFVNTDENGEEL